MTAVEWIFEDRKYVAVFCGDTLVIWGCLGLKYFNPECPQDKFIDGLMAFEEAIY